MSITNDRGTIKYHCFKASCNLSGQYKKGMSLDDMLGIRKNIEIKPLLLKDTTGWDSNLVNYPDVLDYLLKNNCLESYKKHPNSFFYDKIKQRVVYCVYATPNSFSLATGRSLQGAVPKWFKYIAMPHEYYFMACLNPYKNGNDTEGYICEDSASACSLSRVGHALALCGTSWNTEALVKQLAPFVFKEVTIVLDADAQDKSLKLQKDLEAFGKFDRVKVVQLSDDPKYLNKTQLEKELKL